MATQTEIYNAWSATDGVLTARAHSCLARYATFILGGGSSDANRIAWARDALANMPAAVARVRWGIAGDPNVQSQGAAIDESTFQVACELAVNAVVPTVSP